MRFPEDVPVLTDGVIRLRAPRLEDVPAMVEMYRDPDTQYWGGSPPGYQREDAERAVNEKIADGWREGRRWTWAIEYDGQYAGAVALSGGESGVGSVGFTGHPAHRGKGLTTRAVRLVLAHAFDVLGWNRVTWSAFVGNWGSRRVAWRTGFRDLVTAYGGGLANGERRDEWIASIGRDDEREPQNHWWQVVGWIVAAGGAACFRRASPSPAPVVRPRSRRRGDPRAPASEPTRTVFVGNRRLVSRLLRS